MFPHHGFGFPGGGFHHDGFPGGGFPGGGFGFPPPFWSGSAGSW